MSQKPPEPVSWQTIDGSLLAGRYGAVTVTASATPVQIAAFDFVRAYPVLVMSSCDHLQSYGYSVLMLLPGFDLGLLYLESDYRQRRDRLALVA